MKYSRYVLKIIILGLSVILNAVLGSWNVPYALAESNRNVGVGKPLMIRLETNPSTGYGWSPVFDKAYFRLDSHEIEPTSGELLGAPTHARFTFIPIKAGVATIEFNYLRKWENQPVKTERFRFLIEK